MIATCDIKANIRHEYHMCTINVRIKSLLNVHYRNLIWGMNLGGIFRSVYRMCTIKLYSTVDYVDVTSNKHNMLDGFFHFFSSILGLKSPYTVYWDSALNSEQNGYTGT